MTPPRTMNPNCCESGSGCLKHGIVCPVHGRIVPSLFQAPLRNFQKFLRFFEAHTVTIAIVLRGCKLQNSQATSLSLPKSSNSF